MKYKIKFCDFPSFACAMQLTASFITFCTAVWEGFVCLRILSGVVSAIFSLRSDNFKIGGYFQILCNGSFIVTEN